MAARIDRLGTAPMPEGIRLRCFQAGDVDTWTRIQESTGIYDPMPPDLFRREFGTDYRALARRQVYALNPAGIEVGTATAWFPQPPLGTCGRVHWVAVRPTDQRRGIGAALTIRASQILASLGHAEAYLTTASGNHPAISLYASLGFAPLIRGQADGEAWRTICEILAIPEGRWQTKG